MRESGACGRPALGPNALDSICTAENRGEGAAPTYAFVARMRASAIRGWWRSWKALPGLRVAHPGYLEQKTEKPNHGEYGGNSSGSASWRTVRASTEYTLRSLCLRVSALSFSLLFSISAHAESVFGVQLHSQSAAARDSGLFAFPAAQRPFALRSGTGEIYLRHAQNGFVAEWAGDWNVAEQAKPNGQGRLNELYADFSAGGIDLSLGKKVISSGIGFGFRPLDVIQREDRRALFVPRLEGVPLIAAEKIDADSALSFIYFNRLSVTPRNTVRGAHEAVARYYRLHGDLETHALLHLHEQFGVAPGVGFTWVEGQGFELHGAALYQPRFQRVARDASILATNDPWSTREARDDGKAMLGFNWTGEAGYSLLLEAWHDGEAMSDKQWRSLFDLAAAQRALLGLAPDAAVYGNLAWNLRPFEGASVRQNNLLARLSFNGEKYDPYLDLLYTPEDHGYVATLGLTVELRQGLSLNAGARRFGGPADSAYGAFPMNGVVFVEVSGEMVR